LNYTRLFRLLLGFAPESLISAFFQHSGFPFNTPTLLFKRTANVWQSANKTKAFPRKISETPKY